MSHPTCQPLKLRSSMVLFGPYDYRCLKTTQLKSEFLILLIQNSGDSISLQLSFKHIHRVELLDNSEGKGAGLIIHINSFMAQRIQDTLDPKRTDFVNFRTPYAPNSFIIMDLLNADPQSIENLKRMLQTCDNFHRQYVIEQCNKSRNTADAVQSLPVQYTTIIGFNQWKALLGFLRKDVEFEHVETVGETERPLKYTVGKIINYCRETYALRPDSSVVLRRRQTSDDGAHERSPPTGVPSANGRQPPESRHKSYSNSYQHHLSYDGVHDNKSRPTNRMPTPASPLVNTGQYLQKSSQHPQHSQPQQPVRFVVQSNRLSNNNPLQHRPHQHQQQYNSSAGDAASISNNSLNNSHVMDHQYSSPSAAIASPIPPQKALPAVAAYGQPSSPSLYNAFVGGASSSTAANGGGVPELSPYNQSPRQSGALARKAATSSAQKREVCVIDEEEDASAVDDASTSQKRKNDMIFVYPSTHGCSIHYSDLKYLDHSYMLNDTIIDFYLKYIYNDLISEERRNKIYMFNSFFYSRISQPSANTRPYGSANNRWKRVSSNYQIVKSWTKKANLFEMDYLIVPINEDIHWYLAVVVNPKAGIVYKTDSATAANHPTISSFTSTTITPTISITSPTTYSNGDALKTAEGGRPSDAGFSAMKVETNGSNQSSSSSGPFVIVFDSLIDSDRKHSIVQDLLAEYLALEFADKREVMGWSGEYFNKASLRLVTPTGTPQQKNYVDCGVFLLKFAEIFMTNPPRITSTNVSFRSWYPNFQIKGMRDAIKKLIRNMANSIKYADFLPPTPTFTLSVPIKKSGKPRDCKKLPTPAPIDMLMPPLRTRRHSDSSIWEDTKEKQFTSLGMDSLSQSLDSIMAELKDMPPLVLTFPHKKKKLFSSAAAAANAMAAAAARH